MTFFREQIRWLHYSRRTEEADVYWVKNLAMDDLAWPAPKKEHPSGVDLPKASNDSWQA